MEGEGRRRLLILTIAALGAAGMAAVALAGEHAGIVALVTAALLLAVGFYLSRTPATSALKTAVLEPASQGLLPGVVRDVLECLADPIILLSANGHVVFANRASHALLGAGAEKKHISAVLRTPSVLEAVERVAAGGEPETVAFSVLVPVERHYEAFVARAGSAGSPDAGLVLVQLHDLTAVRRTEQMRADFVANASHELRTPLAAVSRLHRHAARPCPDDAEARDALPRHHERRSGPHAPADRRSAVAHPHRAERACAARRA